MEAIWGNFCHQVYFFPSKVKAKQWSDGKANIAILSVHDAYELGKLGFSDLVAYA